MSGFMYSWDAEPPPGGVRYRGVSDKPASAMDTCHALLADGRATSARIEKVYASCGEYASTGFHWVGQPAGAGSSSWAAFAPVPPAELTAVAAYDAPGQPAGPATTG